jgi:hypothetical protein
LFEGSNTVISRYKYDNKFNTRVWVKDLANEIERIFT